MCFNERPWDAATVSGALAEVSQLVIYALVSDSNLYLCCCECSMVEVSQLLVKQWFERDINPDVSRDDCA